MHKFGGISLVLVSVIEEGITHTYSSSLRLCSVPQLLKPHPIVRLLRLNDLVVQQIISHLNVVNDVKDQCFNFAKE